MSTFLLGAVAYDPKVVTIWDGFRAWFATHDFDFDYVLYSNYERQVEAHFAGHFDVAWNSPLAWLQAERIAASAGRQASAVAMRDTDRDLHSVIVVREDSTFESLEDLRGSVVGAGAQDSPQATLIPLDHLAAAGLVPGTDFEVRYFDQLPGKHGDHVGGEKNAAEALLRGDVDAACMIEGNYGVFVSDATLPQGSSRVLGRTEAYDHCNFTVLDDAPKAQVDRFCELLFSMSYDDVAVRPLLDLEGLRVWQRGRTSLYAPLARAVSRFGTIDSFVKSAAGRCS